MNEYFTSGTGKMKNSKCGIIRTDNIGGRGGGKKYGI